MEKPSFNDGLGTRLRATDTPPEPTGKRLRLAAGVVIALGALGVVLASIFWTGS